MHYSAERPAGPVIRAVARGRQGRNGRGRLARLAGCGVIVAWHGVPVALPRPATRGGEFSPPAGPGPLPAVLHGCSGIRPSQVAWAAWLRCEGYAALVLDSFGGRGIRSLCGDSSAEGGGMRSNDVFAAARYLGALPGIDGQRIAAMGFSHGGWTVLWTGSHAARYADTPLKAVLAFYPYCGDLWRYRGSAPLLMLLGGKDDWTPAEPCQRLGETSRSEGDTVEAVLYLEARHGFDGAHIARRPVIPEPRGGRGATVEYDARAHGDGERQVRRFLAQHLRS